MKYWDEKSKKLLTAEELKEETAKRVAEEAKKAAEKDNAGEVDDKLPETPEEDVETMMGEDESDEEKKAAKKPRK